MELTWTMDSFTEYADGDMILAPYDIVLTFDAIADSAGGHEYENWSWVASCENT